ncbi:polypeptide N-acetylgalactosaminyltransferase-like 6 [Trichonephila clavipes]|nr:polypeptide N-acetylgalactosaminyltransferase-like 6 [Trichonephila clavipes]
MTERHRANLFLYVEDRTRDARQFVLSWHKDIRPAKRNICFDVSSSEKQAPVVLWNCHGMQGNQLWKYDMENHHLVHLLTGTCLDCDLQQKQIFMNPCDPNKKTQVWRFETVNVTAIFNCTSKTSNDPNPCDPKRNTSSENCDSDYKFSQEPQPFNQKELSDLVRDLN